MRISNLNRFIAAFANLMLLLLGVSSSLIGSTFQSSEKNINISHLHHIDDDLYTAGTNLNINGTIGGDLSSIGDRINIRGEIDGSANLLCRFATNTGQIRKSLRFLGERITQNGKIDGSLLAAGNEIILEPGSMIQKDVDIGCATSYIDGIIKGNLTAHTSEITLGGLIEGDVEITSKNITFTPPLVVKGNFTYTAHSEIDQDNLSGVTIMGDIKRVEKIVDVEAERSPLVNLLLKIPRLLATFLFGFIIMKVFHRQVKAAIHELTLRPPISFAAGIAGFIILVISLILFFTSLIVTLIGIIAVGDGSVMSGWIAIVFSSLLIPTTGALSAVLILILYSGEAICGMLIGYLIIKRIKPEKTKVSVPGLLLGLIALLLLTLIPYFGGLILIVGILLGAGGIIMGLKNPLPR